MRTLLILCSGASLTDETDAPPSQDDQGQGPKPSFILVVSDAKPGRGCIPVLSEPWSQHHLEYRSARTAASRQQVHLHPMLQASSVTMVIIMRRRLQAVVAVKGSSTCY